MSAPNYQCKTADPDEVRQALKQAQKLTLDELDSMPRIIERFRNEGLLKFPNSEMTRRAVVSHRRKA